MKQNVRGLRRVLKVRDTQKRMKERALMQAGNHYAGLENNAQRIRMLHSETHQGQVGGTARFLAATMELSDRLLHASHVVEISVRDARQELAAAERQNLAAQAIHDGTEKLLNSKVSTLRKREGQKQDISTNILYNIENIRKKERGNDW